MGPFGKSVPIVADLVTDLATDLSGYLAVLLRDTGTVLGAVSRGNIPIFAGILLVVLLLPDRIICSVRTSFAYRWSLSFLRLKLAPAVLALGLVYFCSALVGRYVFVIRDGAGDFCKSTKSQIKQPTCTGPNLAACIKAVASQGQASEMPAECKTVCKPEAILIDTRSLCAATGMSLAAGQTYHFEIKTATEADLTAAETEEVDQKVEGLKASAKGDIAPEIIEQQKLEVHQEFRRRGLTRDNLKWHFCYDYFNLFCYESGVQKVAQPSLLQTSLAIVTAPLKRTLDRPLGNVIVRYGNTGNEEAFIDPDPRPDNAVNDTWINPTVRGELFVYLDKPVSGFWPHMFDASNSGVARITVMAHPK